MNSTAPPSVCWSYGAVTSYSTIHFLWNTKWWRARY